MDVFNTKALFEIADAIHFHSVTTESTRSTDFYEDLTNGECIVRLHTSLQGCDQIRIPHQDVKMLPSGKCMIAGMLECSNPQLRVPSHPFRFSAVFSRLDVMNARFIKIAVDLHKTLKCTNLSSKF